MRCREGAERGLHDGGDVPRKPAHMLARDDNGDGMGIVRVIRVRDELRRASAVCRHGLPGQRNRITAVGLADDVKLRATRQPGRARRGAVLTSPQYAHVHKTARRACWIARLHFAPVGGPLRRCSCTRCASGPE